MGMDEAGQPKEQVTELALPAYVLREETPKPPYPVLGLAALGLSYTPLVVDLSPSRTLVALLWYIPLTQLSQLSQRAHAALSLTLPPLCYVTYAMLLTL